MQQIYFLSLLKVQSSIYKQNYTLLNLIVYKILQMATT